MSSSSTTGLSALLVLLDRDSPLRKNPAQRRKLPNWEKTGPPAAHPPRKLPRFETADGCHLPLLQLPQRVCCPVYSRSEAECNELLEAADNFRQHPLIGLDIEWKVTYEAGVTSRPAATLQLSTDCEAYVFHLSAMPSGTLPANLVAILEDPRVLKCGNKIGNDCLKLRRDFGVRARGLIDLGKLACHALPYGLRAWNLADLVAEVAKAKLPKELRMSDWEATRLSSEQLQYAAADAYASRVVCATLLWRLQKASDERGQHRSAKVDAELLQRVPPNLIEDTPVDPMAPKPAALA